jgi:hypothetical protein
MKVVESRYCGIDCIIAKIGDRFVHAARRAQEEVVFAGVRPLVGLTVAQKEHPRLAQADVLPGREMHV